MMKCCKKNNHVMVELIKSELVYDIKNTAYSFADSNTKEDSSNHELHNVFDVGENGNRDRLARILDSSVEDCKELLHKFTKNETYMGFETNDWEECIGSPCNEEEAYYIDLYVPIGFPQTSVHSLSVYIHDYIVYQSLYEWMMIVYPNGAPQFKELAEDKKKKMKDASCHTSGRTRIRLHPFG